jgi:hypothetical protein
MRKTEPADMTANDFWQIAKTPNNTVSDSRPLFEDPSINLHSAPSNRPVRPVIRCRRVHIIHVVLAFAALRRGAIGADSFRAGASTLDMGLKAFVKVECTPNRNDDSYDQ